MLIETRIQFTIAGLDEGQLAGAVRMARRAMRETATEFHEHVALFEVSRLPGTQILYCIRTLTTRTDKEFVYNYITDELFAYKAVVSHVDLNAVMQLLKSERQTRD